MLETELLVGNATILCRETSCRSHNTNFAAIWPAYRWQFLVCICLFYGLCIFQCCKSNV